MTKEFACPCRVAHVIVEDRLIVEYWLDALSVQDNVCQTQSESITEKVVNRIFKWLAHNVVSSSKFIYMVV